MASQPTYAEFLKQQLTIEPLTGPTPPKNYLTRFPDELYHKAPESHLLRFIYALIGPAGVGWLQKQTYEERLITEAGGLELFNLDRFYGDPFQFGRILEETYDQDPLGVLTRDEWNTIRSKDEAYRSRAIDFVNGARAGNTPLGMKLVARSGLGHEVEIIENYKYLFDTHSDDPIGLPFYGKSNSLNEFIILPRQETPRSEEQTIHITFDVSAPPTGGNFVIWFNGHGTSIDWDADLFDVQEALQALPSIGPNNVAVRGGPAPENDFIVRFVNRFSNEDVPELTAEPSFTGGINVDVEITTTTTSVEAGDETVFIPPRDKHHLQEALDRIRPVATVPTFAEASGRTQRQNWNTVLASSEYHEVTRYVSGQSAVRWPMVDNVHWIESGKEKEAPRVARDLQFHYSGFHNIASITAYGDDALPSEHTGQFGPTQKKLPGFAFLGSADDTLTYTADRSLADYFEPLTITSQTTNGTSLINGIYPTDYLNRPNVPVVKYLDEQFWASKERASGAEYLELDFGAVRAVNFLALEVSHKPLTIEIAYDSLDQAPRTNFIEVTPIAPYPSAVSYDGDLNPWATLEFHFENDLGRIPYTRLLRIKFERDQDTLNPFLYDAVTQTQNPWSVEVRNLRAGRNVSS